MKEKLILFDLDGTLVDTKSFIIKSLNDLSDEFGFNCINEEHVAELRNSMSRKFLKVLGIPLWKAPFLIKKIRIRLGDKISDMNFVDGMEDVLIALEEMGHTLGVLTSNSQVNTKLFLEKYDDKYFSIKCTGVGVFGKHRKIKKLINDKNFDAKNVIYVGDETRDVISAQKAGVSVVSVTWGFNTEYILSTLNPGFIANKPEEIVSIVKSI